MRLRVLAESVDDVEIFHHEPDGLVHVDFDVDNAGDDVEEDGGNGVEGLIRNIKGVKLVRKRRNDSGTFDELWIFTNNEGESVKDIADKIRRILDGTDIDPDLRHSPDKRQTATVTTIGNLTFVEVNGLDN